MKKLLDICIRQKLIVNIVVFMVLLGGAFAVSHTNREAFPNVNLDMVTIKTIYKGAAADDVEQLITLPIEKKLRSVNGIEKVRSYNIENASVIVCYLYSDAKNKDKIAQDIKDAVDKVTNLPVAAEKPAVEQITSEKTPALNIALTTTANTDAAYTALRSTAKDLEDTIYEVEGVAEIERFGYRDREYLIELNPADMSKYRIGMNMLIYRLKMRNIDLPGGPLRIGDNEFILRTKGQYRNADEVRNTVILANDAGYLTRLGDIATVKDSFEEAKVKERVNGKNSIVLKVWKKNSADMIVITDKIKKLLKEYVPDTTTPIDITYFNDYSDLVRTRLSSLIVNAVSGFLLLAAVLVLALGFRMATLVGVSIPITFMLAFMVIKACGITLNIVSMFALVMVLGMIVDFAIVVAENTYRHLEEGVDKRTAVTRGVSEVFWPVTTTLFCMSAAFAPLLFMTGLVGKFVKTIPIVIITCLIGSRFSAFYVLPSHLDSFAKLSSRHKGDSRGPSRFDRFIEKYRAFLANALDHRYKMTLGLIALLVVAVIAGNQFLGFVFMPTGGGKGVFIRTKMPQGTNLDTNEKAIKELETIVNTLPKKELSSVFTHIGREESSILDPAPNDGTHRGTICVNLTPEQHRQRTADEIIIELRKKTSDAQRNGTLDPRLKMDYRVDFDGPPIGLPVNVEIRGPEIETLRTIANEYMAFLATQKGVFDISLDSEPGKEEFRYKVNEAVAARVGVSVVDVAQSIFTAFNGTVATKVNQGEDEEGVRVRFPDWERRRLDSLNQVMVSNPAGGLIPLSMITHYEKQKGFAMINRLNYKRVAQVQANINTSMTTSVAVNKALALKFKDISKRYPGYTVNYGGEEEDRKKSISRLISNFMVALVFIYLILVVFFQSLLVPLVVMSAVPFAIVGLNLALLVHGKPLTLMGLLGLFSVAGIIISNTLVLVQFVTYLRANGRSLKEALIEGGAVRIRPILLTSGVTALGLLPAIYGLGGKDAFVDPLAMAFGYGLIFATFITLVLVPCFYYIAEDYKHFITGILREFGIHMAPNLYNPEPDEGAQRS